MLGAGELGAGELGAGELGAGELGAGELGAGVLGAGELGAGELGAVVGPPPGVQWCFRDAATTARQAAMDGVSVSFVAGTAAGLLITPNSAPLLAT